MKNLLFIAVACFGMAACTSSSTEEKGGDSKLEEKIKKEEAERERKLDIAYESMATDMCECFNDATSGLSDEGRKIIEDSGQDDTDMQKALMEYAEENPMEAMEDGAVLSSLGEADVMTCIAELERKYSNVYTSDSEAQVQAKLITVMKGIDDCKLTYAFVKAGLSR